MAKKQSMSLNPTKTAGTCGRLMCCLKYEQNVYDELLKVFPKIGSTIETPKGVGVIDEINYISGDMRVRLPGKDSFTHIKRDSDTNVAGGVGEGGVIADNPVCEAAGNNSGNSRNSRFADRRPRQQPPQQQKRTVQKKYPNNNS
ncbi:hypothetical protein FACS1894133_7610 [Clostridia bacterium]|nr:hypothetical protein FACS1894133_7610 [Clostridia bacterium]